MEDLSRVIESEQLPLDLPARPYLNDHCVNGRAVLPAVEALERVAQAVKRYRPETDLSAMTGLRFDKFLYLAPNTGPPSAFCEICVHANGDVAAALASRTESKKASLARIKIHAALTFPRQAPRVPELALDLACAPEGVCLSVEQARTYPGLIPFGPFYRNLKTVHVARQGATGEITTPATGEPGAERAWLLGSPFALDAAFHAACVWGQRFAGVIAFPVAVDQRRIYAPTRPGESYFVHVLPLRTVSGELIFDLRIYDRQGRLHEACGGVRMRDVSGGKLKPPGWIRSAPEYPETQRVAAGCRAAAVVELDSLAPFAEETLSIEEMRRFQTMAGRRRKSYLAARLACKRISRLLSGHDTRTDPRRITTVGADRPLPCCPRIDRPSSHSCSVAHDSRFAVAVAADGRVGIDVEQISPRLWESRSLYMSSAEQALSRHSALGEIETAVRIWSIKEAVAKALDMTLADAWQRVRVTAVGSSESRFQIGGQVEPIPAVHAVVERHVFTRVLIDGA